MEVNCFFSNERSAKDHGRRVSRQKRQEREREMVPQSSQPTPCLPFMEALEVENREEFGRGRRRTHM